jgi:hypothetical protein
MFTCRHIAAALILFILIAPFYTTFGSFLFSKGGFTAALIAWFYGFYKTM